MDDGSFVLSPFFFMISPWSLFPNHISAVLCPRFYCFVRGTGTRTRHTCIFCMTKYIGHRRNDLGTVRLIRSMEGAKISWDPYRFDATSDAMRRWRRRSGPVSSWPTRLKTGLPCWLAVAWQPSRPVHVHVQATVCSCRRKIRLGLGPAVGRWYWLGCSRRRNLTQICTSDACPWRCANALSVRSRLVDVLPGPPCSDPCSMRLLSRASHLRRGIVLVVCAMLISSFTCRAAAAHIYQRSYGDVTRDAPLGCLRHI
jgi:hypothetical protein